MDLIDLRTALDMLTKPIQNDSFPQLQTQTLGALTKLMNEDENFLKTAIDFSIISKIQEVMNKTASPEVKAAAQRALDNISEQVAKSPNLLLGQGPPGEAVLAALLETISHPKDLDNLLMKITDAPHGADALLRLALKGLDGKDGINLNDKLKTDILRAFAQTSPAVPTTSPGIMVDIFKRLQDPTVDNDEKVALLHLVGNMKMTPVASKRLLQNNGIKTLLGLLTDENNTDSNLVISLLNALGQMSKDPLLARRLLDLNGEKLW